ncbi:MAG: hypothetical protein OXI32_09305 [bacterium]|nr:hypothetical protein [bacterium]
MPKNVSVRPRRIHRRSDTQSQRRRTNRQAETGSAWEARNMRAAAAMPYAAACAATASIPSSVSDTRLAVQSGWALNVIRQARQYQRRIRIPAGRLRS